MQLTFQALNDLRSAIISMANLKFSADTTRALSANLRTILACAPQYQAIHENIFREKGSPAQGTPAYADYISAFQEEVNQQTTEIQLQKITFDDLKIGFNAKEENAIPLGVIIALDPILKEPGEQN